MYISELSISGYKSYNEEFKIRFNKGLTILVGENGSGKTTIIDAVRLLLNEDEYGRIGISSTDFHKPFNEGAESSDSIEIKSVFSCLDSGQQVAYLPWLDSSDNTVAYLNLKVDNKENIRGRYNRIMWGGESISGIFESELIDTIACIYLPPLRDALNKLEAYRGSRLSRLFRNERPRKGDGSHPLEDIMEAANNSLELNPSIISANNQIKSAIHKSLGSILGQDVLIQMTDASFDRIVEKLRLVFFPKFNSGADRKLFRGLTENSLGYNNIMYLATVLAELERTEHCRHKILLIEEPEAHLHPQLQMRLMKYLKEQSNDTQIIVTTHSPTITASAGLDSLCVLTANSNGEFSSTLIAECNICTKSKKFIDRWLDITKSTLFFAKGIIFVEGIAEAMVVKELSKRVISDLYGSLNNAPKSLDDFGVSIINLNGIYFRHFFELFKGYILNGGVRSEAKHIPIRCAGVTDADPIPVSTSKPTPDNIINPGNTQSKQFSEELIHNSSKECRIFYNMKTFEYDLAMCDNNLSIMYSVIYERYVNKGCAGAVEASDLSLIPWNDVSIIDKADEALYILGLIGEEKGDYAQCLAEKLTNSNIQFTVPEYIKETIKWALNFNEDHNQ